jgi:hypothetical protein
MTPNQNPQFEGGATEKIDPVTGVDLSDIPSTGVEAMPVQIQDAGGVSHQGDMGRLGKN